MSSTGYKAPASVKQFTDHISGTVYPFENLGNVKSCDGALAAVDTSGGITSSRPSTDLVAYDFALPTFKPNARIDGVVVKINRQKAVYAGDIRDLYVRLRKGSSAERGVFGSNYAKTGTNWPEKSTGSAVYGDGDDKWGSTLNPSILNDAGFGVLLRCGGTSSTWTIPAVDCMALNVYYTDPTYSLTPSMVTEVLLGGLFTFTLTLKNTNNAHQGVAIPVSMVLPSGCTLISQSGSNGSYTTSTGKWNAVLSGGSATITLTLRADTVGTKTVNASVDGFSTTTSKAIAVTNPVPEYTIAVAPSVTDVELTEDIDVTLNVSGTAYNTDTIQLNVNIPTGLTLKSNSILSSSNVNNLNVTEGLITFNLTSSSVYDFNFSVKLTLATWGMGSKTITVVENGTGTTGSGSFNIVLTENPEAGGIKTQIRQPTNYNAIAFPTQTTAYAGGIKTEIVSKCKATAEIIKGYIGPVRVNRPHSPTKNSAKNSLIEDGYKDRVNVGKKGDYSEDLPLEIRVPPSDAATLQALVKIDKPVPINTVVECDDMDPLNHRGYATIYGCDIEKINGLLYECNLKLRYLTRNLNPPIYVNRLGQINKYNIKPQYSVELMNSSLALNTYFNITVNSGSLPSKTLSLNNLGSCILKSLDLVSTPATIEYTWSTNQLIGTERVMKILNEDGKTLLEYTVYANTDGTFANITVYNENGSADTDDYEIDLTDGTNYSTVTTLHIDDNVASILESGASGAELFVESLVLDPANYTLLVEIKHISSMSSSTTMDFNIDETHLLSDEKVFYVNQIVSSFPLKGKILEYVREAEDGLLYYYRHDETTAKYYAQPFVIYKGGTNVTNINGTSILNNQYKPDPVVLTNGLVKIIVSFKLRTINLYFYDSLNEEDKWVWIEKFRLNNMENISIVKVDQEKSILSIGGTTWTIWMGRPWIEVTHTEQDIYLLERKDTAWRDEGDGTGAEETINHLIETTIALNNLYYLLLYNEEDQYGLQVIRPDYSAITNKKLPKNSKTIFMPYKKGDKDYNLPGRLAVEWLNMCEQNIQITGK